MESVASAGGLTTPAVGPADSLQQLYREHRLGLVRLGVLLLGEQSLAEDVVQDVFTAMWRRQGLPNDVVAASAYLRKAVVNRCRSHIRRRMFARQKPPPLDPSGPSPADAVELADEHREVLVALGKLPGKQREVLILRYFSNLPVAEVAATLGITEGTVKSQSARALAKLRDLLDGRER